MKNEKIGQESYNDFWKISITFGKNVEMRKKLVDKWVNRYKKLNEGKRITFWLMVDETESIEESFKIVE